MLLLMLMLVLVVMVLVMVVLMLMVVLVTVMMIMVARFIYFHSYCSSVIEMTKTRWTVIGSLMIRNCLYRYHYTKKHTYRYKEPVDVTVYTNCDVDVKVDGIESLNEAGFTTRIENVHEIALKLHKPKNPPRTDGCCYILTVSWVV